MIITYSVQLKFNWGFYVFSELRFRIVPKTISVPITKEYSKIPYELKNDGILRHNYTKPGIYDVTGYMFNLVRDQIGYVYGISHWKKFTVRINLNWGF